MRAIFVIGLLALLLTATAAAAQTPAAAHDEIAPTRPVPLIAPYGQLIDQRRHQDRKNAKHQLSLIAHKPNYVIGSYYFSKPQSGPFRAQFPTRDIDIQPVEIKFQLSLKTLLISNLIGKTGDLWTGYTNRSFWQAFNSGRSSPFRETNHEPEVWLNFSTDRKLGAVHYKGINLGIVHQSNGQSGELSRSWNRLYGLFMFQTKGLYFALKPWWRIPESRSDDDNPDIEKYLGSFEFYAFRQWDGQTLGITLRDNLRLNEDNHGAVQLDFTFPLHNQLRGYVQWFSGYGESLIDYNHETNSIGIGLMLSNWL